MAEINSLFNISGSISGTIMGSHRLKDYKRLSGAHRREWESPRSEVNRVEVKRLRERRQKEYARRRGMPWRDSPFSPQIEISVMSTDAEIQSENERPSEFQEEIASAEEQEQEGKQSHLGSEGEGGAENSHDSHSEEEAEERYSGSEESDEVDEGKVDSKFRAELETHVKLLHSENEKDFHHAVAFFKKRLEDRYNPPISAILDLNILPRCIQLLSSPEYVQQHLEAARLLVQISHREAAHLIPRDEIGKGNSRVSKVVIDAGGVPVLIDMILSENLELAQQAICAVGYVIRDGPKARDCVLDQGIIPAILKFTKDRVKEFSYLLAFVILVLCRAEPHVSIHKIVPLFGLMKEILTDSTRSGTNDVCQALSHLSDGGDEESLIIFDSGMCPFLMKILKDAYTGNEAYAAVFHILGNIASVGNAHRQNVLDLGALEYFKGRADFLDHSVRLEIYTFISKISSGTRDHMQRLIDCGWITQAVKTLSKASDIGWFSATEKKCCHCFCNVLTNGSPHQQRYIISAKCVPPLCAMLKRRSDVELDILEAFESFLKNTIGQPVNKMFVEALKECGGLDIIKEIGEFLTDLKPYNQIIPSIVELCTARPE